MRLLFILLLTSSIAFGQNLTISGHFYNQSGPVNCKLLKVYEDGTTKTLQSFSRNYYYSFELAQDINYQLLFENNGVYHTVNFTPKSGGEYAMSIDYSKPEQQHIVLFYKGHGLYDVFHLTDKEFVDLCATQATAQK